ncbi:MAG TPA: DUF4349 domain-containing protein [Gemmatimonadaceae bacterium]
MKLCTALLAVSIIACGRDAGRSGSAASDSVAIADAAVFSGKAMGTAAASPAPAMPARPMMANEASSDGQQSVGIDQFQNIDAGAQPPMIVRTGQAFIEVEKVDAGILKIRQLAAQVGAYVGNSSMSGGRDQIRTATMELKIPSARYDAAVGSLSSIGKVETVNSNAQDVGEEFVDITARVTNSRRLEERLLNLLATRTGKLDEVLRVEHEVARVREEIERYEGRLRYLSTRAAVSTLNITIHEPAPILGNDPGENPIAAALRRAWQNFVGLVAGLVASLGVLIPLAVIAVAVWLAYKRWRRRQ